jgi:hypothetical protein
MILGCQQLSGEQLVAEDVLSIISRWTLSLSWDIFHHMRDVMDDFKTLAGLLSRFLFAVFNTQVPLLHHAG